MENFLLGLFALLQNARINLMTALEFPLIIGFASGLIMAGFLYGVIVTHFPRNAIRILYSRDIFNCYVDHCKEKGLDPFKERDLGQFKQSLHSLETLFLLTFFSFLLFISIILWSY